MNETKFFTSNKLTDLVEITSKKTYVNEEKNTITCVLNGEISWSNLEHFSLTPNSIVKRLNMKGVRPTPMGILFTVSGVAKCSPTDNFNKAVGNKLAYYRALKQTYCLAQRTFKLVSNDLYKMWGIFQTQCDKFDDLVFHYDTMLWEISHEKK